jgi:hypothetical protein
MTEQEEATYRFYDTQYDFESRTAQYQTIGSWPPFFETSQA